MEHRRTTSDVVLVMSPDGPDVVVSADRTSDLFANRDVDDATPVRKENVPRTGMRGLVVLWDCDGTTNFVERKQFRDECFVEGDNRYERTLDGRVHVDRIST